VGGDGMPPEVDVRDLEESHASRAMTASV